MGTAMLLPHQDIARADVVTTDDMVTHAVIEVSRDARGAVTVKVHDWSDGSLTVETVKE